MQCEVCVLNCVLFHVKRERSDDCKSVKVLQSHVDVLKGEPGSCDEACVTSSDVGGQVIDIKIEGDIDVKEENDSERMESPAVETASEVSRAS
jgi:hypothetical protein